MFRKYLLVSTLVCGLMSVSIGQPIDRDELSEMEQEQRRALHYILNQGAPDLGAKPSPVLGVPVYHKHNMDQDLSTTNQEALDLGVIQGGFGAPGVGVTPGGFGAPGIGVIPRPNPIILRGIANK